jgi:hypothetical protein
MGHKIKIAESHVLGIHDFSQANSFQGMEFLWL